MKRRQALKISSIATVGLTATIHGGCSKNNILFNHGVASGDPLSDRVILWTRVTPLKPGPVRVNLEISPDQSFDSIVFSKTLSTSSLLDYTIKYDFSIQNILRSGETFFYRFNSSGSMSEVGKTRTLAADVTQIKMGVFSCSNFPAGFFNAYQAAAEADDLDLWLHLGDYLYAVSYTHLTLPTNREV